MGYQDMLSNADSGIEQDTLAEPEQKHKPFWKRFRLAQDTLTDPNTGKTTAFTPQQMPSATTLSDMNVTPGHSTFTAQPDLVTPSASGAIGPPSVEPQPPQIQTQGGRLDLSSHPIPNLPIFHAGRFSTTDANGLPAPVNAGETKLGKLAHFLITMGQGGIAGRAADEAAIAQSGGHRGAGFGTGFMAAEQTPMQLASMRQGVEKGALENELTRAGLQPVSTPLGPMPAALAGKILAPYLSYEGRVRSSQIGADSRESVAQINQRYKATPQGIYDTQERGYVPGTQVGAVVTPELAKRYDLENQWIGQPITLTNMAGLMRGSVFEYMPMQTAQGPIDVNRRTSTATPIVGPEGQRYQPPALASPREVADINNPGETVIVPAGQAFGQPGVQSASVQVPKAAAKAEVPTKIGDTKIAFNTAMQHAQLLRDAATALNSNDTKVLNTIKNRFKTEFGSSDVTNFQVIAAAYSRELTKMLTSGHITDSEIASAGATLPPNASTEQILDAITSYEKLASSKLNVLNQQKQAAMDAVKRNTKSQPTVPTQSASPAATPAAAKTDHSDLDFKPAKRK